MVTALIAVGYAALFKQVEAFHLWLYATDRDWIFVVAPVAFLGSWYLVWRLAPWPVAAASPS